MEQRAILKQGNAYGYVDTTGKLVTPLHFDQASYYQQGQAKVYQGSHWMKLDLQGAVIEDGLQGEVFWTWVKWGALLGDILFFIYYARRHKLTLLG